MTGHLDQARFAKLLALLGSDNENERSTAFEAATRMLRNVGMTWGDYATRASAQQAPWDYWENGSRREIAALKWSLEDTRRIDRKLREDNFKLRRDNEQLWKLIKQPKRLHTALVEMLRNAKLVVDELRDLKTSAPPRDETPPTPRRRKTP